MDGVFMECDEVCAKKMVKIGNGDAQWLNKEVKTQQ